MYNFPRINNDDFGGLHLFMERKNGVAILDGVLGDDNKRVVVKVIEDVAKAIEEIKMASFLIDQGKAKKRNPFVEVLGIADFNSKSAIVMPKYAGNLREALADERATFSSYFNVIDRLVDAVDVLHSNQIVVDIKSSNVLMLKKDDEFDDGVLVTGK